MNRFQYILLAIGVLLILGWVFLDDPIKQKVVQEAMQPNSEEIQVNPEAPSGEPEIIAEDLTVPWAIAFLPDGDMLVTERGGKLKRLGKSSADFTINGVSAKGEGGLLGMALHPNFKQNNFLYLYFTTGDSTNKIVRYRLQNNQLTEDRTIIENIPGASNHDGGRIAFGPDDLLYITTGDAQETSNAQDKNSLAGKILRLHDDGSIPADNPFSNAVYSLGHRNPQGLAWDSQDRLWATEHGRSGASTGLDELNLIERGQNYGWPTIQGDETQTGMKTPVTNSGAKATWAPAGLAINGNTIYFAGLRGQSLYQTNISGNSVGTVTANFFSQYGRLRAVTIHDGYLYFSTSNRDGRGRPTAGDDKIFRLKL
jgi:glucose/arabinose dehydrogenase